MRRWLSIRSEWGVNRGIAKGGERGDLGVLVCRCAEICRFWPFSGDLSDFLVGLEGE